MKHMHVGGKRAPRIDPRTLQLSAFTTALPKPLASIDDSSKCSWPMYANDVLGDCTIAAAAHMEELWGALESEPVRPTTAQVKAAYFATGTEDDGRVMLDVLKFWNKTGIAKRKLAAYAAVGIGDITHLKLSMQMFGGVYVGLALPLSAQEDIGRVWDVTKGARAAKGSWGGHCVNWCGYNATGPVVITWGKPQQMTWAFWRAYADEAYALLTQQWIDAPATSGIDFPALRAALVALGKVDAPAAPVAHHAARKHAGQKAQAEA